MDTTKTEKPELYMAMLAPKATIRYGQEGKCMVSANTKVVCFTDLRHVTDGVRFTAEEWRGVVEFVSQQMVPVGDSSGETKCHC